MSIQSTYRHLLATYGPQVAQNYLRVQREYRQTNEPIRQTRWRSNDIKRDRVFTPAQSRVLSVQHSAGMSCRAIAEQWGVSPGTVSSVLRERGAYDPKRSNLL